MLERKRQDNLLFFRNLWYTLSYPNRKGTFFLRTIGRLLLSAIFLVLTVLLVLAAKYAPALVFSFYPEFSRKLLSVISSVTKAIPLAVWELLAGLAVLWLLYTFVRIFTQRRSFLCWLAGIVLSVCVGLFLFVALWGLNHFGPTVGEQLGLSVREYTKQELTDATRYYAAQVNALADDVSRDDQGLAQLSSFEELSKQAGAGYDKLAARYELFTGSHDPVKKLATWRMFSQFGITGIFICFTGEACVNPDTYEVWLPFTMCHELAHRQTVAAEDGANFCAYLACMENESPEFRYSGAIAAYVYCHNALYKADKTAASEIWQSLKEGVRADIQAANTHYAQYEGKVQDAATKVNDTYLKAFSEEAGVQSYGEAADLLIAWYLEKK